MATSADGRLGGTGTRLWCRSVAVAPTASPGPESANGPYAKGLERSADAAGGTSDLRRGEDSGDYEGVRQKEDDEAAVAYGIHASSMCICPLVGQGHPLRPLVDGLNGRVAVRDGDVLKELDDMRDGGLRVLGLKLTPTAQSVADGADS